MIAVVGAFNQEKALVGAFSVIIQLQTSLRLVSSSSEVISARVNATASRVSVLVAHSTLIPDPKLYIWDVENDVILYFNFSSGKNDQDDSCSVPPNSARSERGHDSSKVTTNIFNSTQI